MKIAVVLVGVLSVCCQPLTASTILPIKLMSFNIRFDSGDASNSANAWFSPRGVDRRDLAFNVINEYGPDILGVQEALNQQVLDLQGELTEHDFYGVGRNNGMRSGEYGGIFFRSERFTQTSSGTFWLNENADTPGTFFPGTCCARIASWVTLEDALADGQEYFVLNTHWDHQVQAAREFSAVLIRERIGSLAGNRPVIVMGDLNATPTNPAFVDLLGTNEPDELQLRDSYRDVFPEIDRQEATFHGFGGGTFGSRIDYVLHSDDFQAEQAGIVRTSYDGNYPSDHYPVTVTLQGPGVPIPEPTTLGLVVVAVLLCVPRSLKGAARF